MVSREIIPLGLDPFRLPRAEQVTALDRPNKPLILFRLPPIKGCIIWLKHWGELEGAHCWIVGDGPLRSLLERTIQKLQLVDRITLVGAASEADKWRLYRTCDLLVALSGKTESFGMVLLEATHFQRPVVVTDAAGSGMVWVMEQLPWQQSSQSECPSQPCSRVSRLATSFEQEKPSRNLSAP